MNAAAVEVVKDLPDITIAYGVSDEFSFVLHRTTTLFERRESKLVTTITSTFTSWYMHLWPRYFPNTPLSPPLPTFDGRAVCYPTEENLKDYMSWRQADCENTLLGVSSCGGANGVVGHINNLYNTTFWALVQQGEMTTQEAEDTLKVIYGSCFRYLLLSLIYRNCRAPSRKTKMKSYSRVSRSTTTTNPSISRRAAWYSGITKTPPILKTRCHNSAASSMKDRNHNSRRKRKGQRKHR